MNQVIQVIELADDLKKRLDQLCQAYDIPGLFITDHFFEIRNQVDLNAEKILNELEDNNDQKAISKVKEKRAEFIRIINELEKKVLDQLPAYSTSSTEAYRSLIQKVKQFEGNRSQDINDIEDAYVQLAWEIYEETNQLEKRLLGNQSIVYVQSDYMDQLGFLIYFPENHFNSIETSFIK